MSTMTTTTSDADGTAAGNAIKPGREPKPIRPFGLRDKIGYMFGDFGNDFTFMFASSFLMIFYTKVMGIPGAAVGTLFLVARIIDAFADVTVGVLVDRAKTHPNGKYRVVMMKFAAPVTIFSFLMYQTVFIDSSMGVKTAYMYVTYIVWGILYSCVNIPYGSMASVLSPEPKDRTSLSTFRSIGGSFAGMFIGVVGPLVIYESDAAGNQIIRGGEGSHIFAIAAGLFSALAFVWYLVCYLSVTERVKAENHVKADRDADRRGIAHMLGSAFSSRAMVGLIGAALSLMLAQLFLGQMINFLFADFYRHAAYASVATTIGTVVMLCLAPTVMPLAKKFGHRTMAVGGMTISAVAMFTLYLLHTDNPFVFLAGYGVAQIGLGTFNLIIWAMVTDVIDDIEATKGIREDATCYSVYSFSRKLGQAFAGWMSGVSLTWIGYQSGATAVQSEGTINGLYMYTTLIPAVFLALTVVFLIVVYPLTKKRVDDNAATLQAKRMATDR